jgi:uncharacterized repeat protein (TIGR01451 family)
MARRFLPSALLVLLFVPLLSAQPQAIDLAITKTATNANPNVGGTFNYTLLVTNTGATATNVVVTDVLPASPAQMSATGITTTAGSCSGTTTVTCNLGSLNGGASATINITTSAPLAGFYSNTADVTGTEFDLNTANNSSTIRITAIGGTPTAPTLGTWALLGLAAALMAAAVMRMRV